MAYFVHTALRMFHAGKSDVDTEAGKSDLYKQRRDNSYIT